MINFNCNCTGERHFHATSINSRVAGWRLEDIDDNLAADFDGSLSGLGVDLSVASYNMRSVSQNSSFFPLQSFIG